MEFKVAQTIIQNLSGRLRYMLLMSVGLLISNIFLICLMWWSLVHQERIIVPVDVKEAFTVSANRVDASYLRQMAIFFCSARLNITPSNVKENHKIVLQYTDQEFYNKFVSILSSEEEEIVKQNISAVFYPEEVIPDPQKTTVLIKGTMARFVGNVALPVVKKNYLLKFSYRNGNLKITEFVGASEIIEENKEGSNENAKIY
jgi:conjugal transfer pilus assembly protein TraE